jgi:hypothetical protein
VRIVKHTFQRCFIILLFTVSQIFLSALLLTVSLGLLNNQPQFFDAMVDGWHCKRHFPLPVLLVPCRLTMLTQQAKDPIAEPAWIQISVMSISVQSGLNHDADVSFCLFCLMSWCLFWHSWCAAALRVGRTPVYVKTCNGQDMMSATWRKERSTVETNEIMNTTATHRSESWCWRLLLSFFSNVLMLVLMQLVGGCP